MPTPGLTEVAIGAVAKAVLEQISKQLVQTVVPPDRLKAWLGRDPQRLAFEVALTGALASFAERHPSWASSFFDQHFLANRASPILAKCLEPGGRPEPAELASAFADQFGSDSEGRQQQINDVMPAASDFLDLLRTELRHRNEFRALYDSRAMDSISENTAQTVEELRELRSELAKLLVRANVKYSVALSRSQGILVGDHGQQINIFQLLGNAPDELLSHIRSQQFETLINERTRGFVGREFIFQSIDGLMRDREFPSGYIIVKGEPGIGKTALAGELVKRRGYVHHFNIATDNIVSAGDFLRNVCAQLIIRYQLPHRALPKDVTRDSGFLSQLLREVSGARGSQPVVVVVDALDEAVDPIDPASLHPQNPPNRLYLPHNLHDGVFFVITTREQANYRLSADRIKDIYIRDNDPRNVEDVQQYIVKFVHEHAPKMVPAIAQWKVDETQFATIISERSQGNFMYLVHVLRDIRDGSLNKSNIENIRNLPQGLREYYWRHWVQMANENEVRFTTLYKPVICMLAAVREAVSVARVSEWTKLPPSDIKRVIREWRPFLNEDETEGTEVRYRIYHTSFQEFLRDEIGLVAQHQAISEAALSKIPGF